MSLKDNDLGVFLAQILGTPKIQFPNLIKNPIYVVPTFIAAIICAPLATVMFHFQVSYELAGVGTAAMIAPIAIFTSQGMSIFLIFLTFGIVLPIVITLSYPSYFENDGKSKSWRTSYRSPIMEFLRQNEINRKRSLVGRCQAVFLLYKNLKPFNMLSKVFVKSIGEKPLSRVN